MYTMMSDDSMCIKKGTKCTHADVFCSQKVELWEIELPTAFDQTTRVSALERTAAPQLHPSMMVGSDTNDFP